MSAKLVCNILSICVNCAVILVLLLLPGAPALARHPVERPDTAGQYPARILRDDFHPTENNLASPLATAPTYHWHTFLGGSNIDSGNDIAVDGNGNIYLVGESLAGWNGPGATAPLNSHSGSWDIVIVKLSSGGAYQWHTFLGSGNNDYGHSLALDSSGNIYVTGESAATWNGPGTTAPLNNHAGNTDIVVVKLNSSGVYQWHTFMGSGWSDVGFGMTVDSSGNVYIAGESNGTWSGPGAVAPINSFAAGSDAVILKLNSNGAYQWHTFMGGNWSDAGRSIVVDGSGLYIAGESSGSWDGQGYGLAVDSSGNVYVAGESNSGWNGPGPTAPTNAYTANYDMTVLKLNSSGAYQWHTFMGGSSNEYCRGLAIGGNGSQVYVTGYSNAGWNGPGGITPLNGHAGGSDITLVTLNGSGAYQWHTFMGGSGNESGYGVAISAGVYLIGGGNSWNGPDGSLPLNDHAGGTVDITVLTVSHRVYLPIILRNQ